MAKTFTYTDILDVVGKSLPKILEDQFSSLACNAGTNLAWYAYDWRESLKTLPPFYLTANQQDHNLPLAIVPSDFHGLRKTQLVRYTDQAISKQDLFVAKDLLLTHIKDIPHSISYEASIIGFRLFPRVPNNIGTPNWFVEGTYKARPTLVTNGALNTPLPFDDMYFNVLVECIRWAMLMLAGIPTAGQAQMQSGQVIYTGQLAQALSAIEMMASQEGVNDGDVRISPDQALVPHSLGTPYSFPSLFRLYG